MNLRQFVFFDETSTEDTSNFIYNPGNAGLLSIEVSGESVDLQPEAQIDTKDNETWHSVGGIKMSDLSKVEKIEEAGIYCFPMTGIQRFRISKTSGTDLKVYGMMTE